MNIPKKTMYIGLGVIAVLGIVWYYNRQKAKKQSAGTISMANQTGKMTAQASQALKDKLAAGGKTGVLNTIVQEEKV